MTTFDQIASRIIKGQERIIGPIAWTEADRVVGMHTVDHMSVVIDDANEQSVIDRLVSQYEHFFGRAAREACKEAVASLLADLPAAEVPSSLR